MNNMDEKRKPTNPSQGVNRWIEGRDYTRQVYQNLMAGGVAG